MRDGHSRAGNSLAGNSRAGNSRAGISQAILLCGYGAHLGIGLGITVLLGRSLSAADFGFFALIASAFTFARDATDLGSTVAAARDIRRDPASERPLIEGLLAWRTGVGVLLGLAALGFAWSQPDSARAGVLVAGAMVLACMGPTAFNAIFHARQTQLGVTLLSLGTQTLLLGACWLSIAGGNSGSAPTAWLVGREFIGLVGLAWLGRLALGYWPALRVQWPAMRGFVWSAGFWALAALCRHLLGQVDLISVYLLRGEAEAGALAAAYRPLAPTFVIPWLATAPLVPVLAMAVDLDPTRYRALLRSALVLALGLGSLLGCCVFMIAPDLVSLLYAGRYTAGALDAVPAMRWLSLAVPPIQLVAVASVALLALRRERLALAVAAVALAIKCIANAVWVPQFGFIAAAQITAAIEWLLAVSLCILVLFQGCAAWRPGALLWALLPTLLLGVTASQLGSTPWIRVGLVLAFTCVGLGWLLLSPAGKGYFAALRAASAVGRPTGRGDVPRNGDR